MEALQVTKIDPHSAVHVAQLLELLDHYARDPMGGGKPLAADSRARLPGALAAFPGYHGAIAHLEGHAVGLVNCFTGFSTFAARPLLNIHDMVVHRDWRRRGVATALLAWAEQQARAAGCCKLTLEVLSNNLPAMAAYRDAGYVPYELDPAAGQALLLQKLL